MEKNTNRRINYLTIILWTLAILLVIPNLIRIFDNNFWGDEAFTIRLAKMTFSEMLSATAADVHPPLYYWIVQMAYKIAGNNGVIYHLVSLIPYLLIMLLALTVIRKWFSETASVILMILCSLQENAVNFNVEVRMYSWGALFLLLSFLALYQILTLNSKRHYVYFVLASLASAYTHYYCLVSVAFFYIILILWALIKRKDYFKRTLIACVATVAGYLPWFLVLLQTFQRTMSDFWMTNIPYLKDCIGYFFSGRLQYVLFAIMMVAVVVYAWYQRKSTETLLWLAAGISSLFGTILVGNLVSRLFRPVFIVRYLYPVSIIAWFLLAIGIAGCKYKRIYTLVIVTVLLYVGIPPYIEVYQAEKAQDQLLQETLSATSMISGDNDVILTNLKHIDWTVAEYYYPDVDCELIDIESLPILEQDKNYYLMLPTPAEPKIIDQLDDQGFSLEILVDQGTLGTNPVNIYQLKR